METWQWLADRWDGLKVVSLPMRDGNGKSPPCGVRSYEVVSLPMRDGNWEWPVRILNEDGVVSLPMRDGNTRYAAGYWE